MTFAYVVSGSTILGDLRFKYGTFTNGTQDTGGDITTGLNAIFAEGACVNSHVGSNLPKVTKSGGTLSIVTEEGADGTWWAIGK